MLSHVALAAAPLSLFLAQMSATAASGEGNASVMLTREMVQFAYWMGGLVTFATFALVLVNLWDKLRHKPPMHEVYATQANLKILTERTEEVDKRYAKSSDLEQMRVWVTKEIAATNHNVERMDERTEGSMKQLEDRVLSQISANRSNTDQQMGSLSGKIDSIQTGFQSFTNDVFRAIGKLEGTTDQQQRKAA